MNREEIIKLIVEERLKQLDNPSLSDHLKTKNDWTALAGYYLFESSSRPDKHVSFSEFRESLIKASAVLLAALETSFSLENSEVKDILNNLKSD